MGTVSDAAPGAARDFSGGAVHAVPADLATALTADARAAELWESLTVLGRNEFLCWIGDARRADTRARRIRRTLEEMHEGKRRPCCWPGCAHRERTGSPAAQSGAG